MKLKRIGVISTLCLGVLLIGGCGSVAKLSNGEDAVVTFKDDVKISVNKLYEELKNKYALSSLVNMIDLEILEREFSSDVELAKATAEATIKAIEEQYSDENTMLQAIQYYTGFSTVDAYKEYLYISNLQDKAAEEYAKDQISDKEIKNYYKNNIVGDIEVSYILVTPDVKDGATQDDITAAEEAAKKAIDEVIDKLNAAKKENKDLSETFASLAKDYSDDDSTKDKGGSLGRINKDTLSSSYDELVTAAYKLKDGEYSTELITTELGYVVVYRSASYDKKPIEEVRDSIARKLGKLLLQQDATVSVNAMKYYRELYKVDIQDSELAKQYDRYMTNVLNQAANANKSE